MEVRQHQAVQVVGELLRGEVVAQLPVLGARPVHLRERVGQVPVVAHQLVAHRRRAGRRTRWTPRRTGSRPTRRSTARASARTRCGCAGRPRGAASAGRMTCSTNRSRAWPEDRQLQRLLGPEVRVEAALGQPRGRGERPDGQTGDAEAPGDLDRLVEHRLPRLVALAHAQFSTMCFSTSPTRGCDPGPGRRRHHAR